MLTEKDVTSVRPSSNQNVRPSGACINVDEIRRKRQEQIAATFSAARDQGTTLVQIGDTANAFLAQLESEHLSEGVEIIEQKPLRPLVDRAAPILKKLERMPMLRKRRNTGVWDVERPAATPEELFSAAMRSLGFTPSETETFEASNERQRQECAAKKKWWGR
jgi:hypothetical protein